MDMAKRVGFGIKEWAEYVEFRVKSGLPVEEDFTLAMLEMEVPYERLGCDTFDEFLTTHVPSIQEMLREPMKKERLVADMDSIGDLKVGSRVIWFGIDSTTFKGTVKWLGSIERILCAGVMADEKIGSPFPIVWKRRRLFYTPPGHSLMLRGNELILKSDYAQRQTSLLSRALSKLMRKVSIRERPREITNVELAAVDPEKLRQFDVIYPYSVDSGPNGLQVGDSIIWATNAGSFTGTVKWLGHLTCQSGLSVGIEFKVAIGNCSGTFKGHKLFECGENHGKFLCVKCVRKTDSTRIETSIEKVGFNSTPTFDHVNQDLCLYWEQHQHLPRQFNIGDTVLYQRDTTSYYTGSVEWVGGDSESQMAGFKFVSLKLPALKNLKNSKNSPIKNKTPPTLPLPVGCPADIDTIVPFGKLVRYNVTLPNQSPNTSPTLPQMSSLALACRRLSNRSRTYNPTGRASHEWFPQKGVMTPCISPEKLNRLIGYKRGIQGRPNSSHMDALLFAIFSCSETFDKILLQTQDKEPLTIQIFKEILRTEVANRLRRKFYCPASNVQAVAQVFSSAEQSILPGKPDQVLETLLQKVNQTSPILSYSNGTTAYVHRINSTSAVLSENVVTVQTLLEADMKLQNLQFQNVPVLVVVLPQREDDDMTPPKLFVPNLNLDLTNVVLKNASPLESSNPCTLCGENGNMECADCESLVVSDPGSDSSVNIFCSQCFDVFHQHWSRRNHSKKRPPSAEKQGETFELQAIICTRENQSIAFVKCGEIKGGSAEWIVHDSVCDGSSPQIQNVFSLTECLRDLEKEPSSVQKDWTTFISEVKIILSFAQMCIYAPTSSGTSA